MVLAACDSSGARDQSGEDIDWVLSAALHDTEEVFEAVHYGISRWVVSHLLFSKLTG